MTQKDMTVTFIENLTQFAKMQELTVKELCQYLEIHPNNFYRWKRGEVQIGTATAQKLIERLNENLGVNMETSWFFIDSLGKEGVTQWQT